MDGKDDNTLLQCIINGLDQGSRGDGFGWSNRIVRVEDLDDGESLELGVLDLEDHPASYLLGFTAPPSWRVLGVACCAWAGPLAKPGEEQVRPSAHPEAVRVRVTALTARSGARAGRIRRSDGEVTEVRDGHGLIDDCLSRAFGLPTPPPQVPAQHLVAVRWIAGLLAGGASDLPERVPPGGGWEVIRRRLMGGEWNDDYNLTPADAEWMDTGMLARWCLGEHPALEAMLGRLEQDLGAPAARWARREVTRLLRAA